MKYHRTRPLHVEFNLTDACNLNCKGCSHFSPLAPREFIPLKNLERDVNILSRNCPDIPEVAIIGGEPLIYPQITEAIKILRTGFPNSKIELYTNGIVLEWMKDEFWEAAKKCDVIISITRYPIKFDYEHVENLCKKNSVKWNIFYDRGQKDGFFHFSLDKSGEQNPYISHFKCFNFGCLTVKDGKIFPCPISACVGHLNRAFNLDFKHSTGDFLKIEDVKNTKDLLSLRNHPVPFCKYCRETRVGEPYGASKRLPEEWVD